MVTDRKGLVLTMALVLAGCGEPAAEGSNPDDNAPLQRVINVEVQSLAAVLF
jgi:hypothetical protein